MTMVPDPSSVLPTRSQDFPSRDRAITTHRAPPTGAQLQENELRLTSPMANADTGATSDLVVTWMLVLVAFVAPRIAETRTSNVDRGLSPRTRTFRSVAFDCATAFHEEPFRNSTTK